MRFRMGMLIGGGVGYVLGAKAGRERYQRIVEAWQHLRESEPMRRVTEEGSRTVRETAQQAADKMRSWRSRREQETITLPDVEPVTPTTTTLP